MTLPYKTGAIINGPHDSKYEIVGIRPLTDQPGQGIRLALRPMGKSWLDVISLGVPTDGSPGELRVYLPDALPDPVDTRAINWGRTYGVHPLVCEIKGGDTLLPGPKKGRPTRNEIGQGGARQSGPLVVQDISLLPDGRMAVRVFEIGTGAPRTYRRDPLETLDGAALRPSRPRHQIPHPDRWTGPYRSPTGAVFLFQERAARRPSKHDPTYDPTAPPLYDEETGEVVPYYVLKPPAKSGHDYVLADISTLTSSALKHPIARKLYEGVFGDASNANEIPGSDEG